MKNKFEVGDKVKFNDFDDTNQFCCLVIESVDEKNEQYFYQDQYGRWHEETKLKLFKRKPKTVNDFVLEYLQSEEVCFQEQKLKRLEKIQNVPEIMLTTTKMIIDNIKKGKIDVNNINQFGDFELIKYKWVIDKRGTYALLITPSCELNYFPSGKYGSYIKKVEK